MAWWYRIWRLLVWHQIVDASRFVGLRDRLRCPDCQAVGTWKPHGGLFDGADVRRIRRWMCKWCGFYIGPEGVQRCFPDVARGHWALPHNIDPTSPSTPDPTPKEVVQASVIGKFRPWYG